MEKECKKCGAVYEITGYDYPMRDKDSIKCDYCGSVIFSWNGGVIYSSKIISEPKGEYIKKQKTCA